MKGNQGVQPSGLMPFDPSFLSVKNQNGIYKWSSHVYLIKRKDQKET
jgi:hypothetical protein